MPNFPISGMLRDHLLARVGTLTSRPVSLALGGFPLTEDQVQHAVLAEPHLSMMRQLHAEGIKTVETHRELRLALLRDSNLPGINRSAVVYLNVPGGVFVGRATMYSIPVTEFSVNENHYLIPSFDNLDDNQREGLTIWVERCVRQLRVQQVAHYVAKQVLTHFAPTTSHLLAIWPELATLVDPSSAYYRADKEKYEKWVERFRNPARRNFSAYKPDPQVRETFAKMIELANTQLAAGLLLKDYVWKKGQIRASIEHWEQLDRDLRLPN